MSMKKPKEQVSELFIHIMVREGQKYSHCEYTSEMLNVGVTEKQLPKAAFDFAIDNMPREFNRLSNSEQKEVEKRLRKYFKEQLT